MLKPQQAVLQWMAQRFPKAIFYKPTTQPIVALTIDDAPTPDDPGDRSTQWILDAIADYNQSVDDPTWRAKATFFIITRHLRDDSTILERIQAAGHELANHGTEDVKAFLQTPAQFEQQFWEAHHCLMQHTPHLIRWYRPGYAFYNAGMLNCLQQCPGYEPRFPLASLLPIDPYRLTNHPPFTLGYLTQFIFPGAILVLHAGSVQRCANTAAVFTPLLQTLRQRAYRVVTLSELWDT